MLGLAFLAFSFSVTNQTIIPTIRITSILLVLLIISSSTRRGHLSG